MKLTLVFVVCVTLFRSSHGQDLQYFQKLCSDFDQLAGGQFAVLTFGKITGTYVPTPLQTELSKQTGNYLYAAVKKTPPRRHSEEQILDTTVLDAAFQRWKSSKPKETPVINLFSLNSPCNEKCSGLISSTKARLKIQDFYVGWQYSYIPNTEASLQDKAKMDEAKRDFQYGLKTLIEASVRIIWSSNGICSRKPKQGPSFQEQVYNCVLGSCKDYRKYKNCKNLDNFKSDLAKVINKLVWDCTDNRRSTDWTCYDSGLTALRIAKQAKCNLSGGFLSCMPKFNVMLGPPIDPLRNVPREISSSLKDLMGDYNEGYCMQ